jgi:2-dehydro-3-deoxygalactonokinase
MSPNANLTQGKLIAVDWGTSRLRAWLVDGAGAIVAETVSDQGIGTLAGGHEAVFEKVVAGWPNVPAIMAGMVGSRQGWREAAYVPCPATVSSIAAAMTRFTTASGRPVAIVPGLKVTADEGNVLRGEETQIVGAVDREPGFGGTCILPGTHSKWVRVERGAIVDFESFISGELFELLSRRSLLRHSVSDPDSAGDVSEVVDFGRGVERMTRDGVPFLAALFSVRVRQLLADAKPADNLAYLSGLVIGGEVAAAVTLKAIEPDMPIRIIGAGPLARAYHKALAITGHKAEVLDGDKMVLAGLVHLARTTGFSPGGTA